MSIWSTFRNAFFGKQPEPPALLPPSTSDDNPFGITVTAQLESRSPGVQVEGAAPILEPYERHYHRDYRRENDLPHVIRINEPPPVKGRAHKIMEYVEVKGISREGMRQNAEALINGVHRRLELERDPGNVYDRNAIKILGLWYDPNGNEERRGQIGWVPASVAKEIEADFSSCEIHATLCAMFKPIDGKSPGVRCDLWWIDPPPIKKKKARKNSNSLP
jgi:hypothetical protein